MQASFIRYIDCISIRNDQMAILHPSRTLVFIFLSTFGFGVSQAIADESQSLFRYLGVGWGAGYHSCSPSSTARNAHGFCCTDRYSRPANCGCIDCVGYRGGQSFTGNPRHDQGYGPQGPVSPQAYSRPLNQLNPMHGPQDLQPALPPLQPFTPAQQTLPKTNGGSLPRQQDPPANSGSSQNPFGVTSHTYRQYNSVPARMTSPQIGTQPSYLSAWQRRQIEYLGNQNIASANDNRIQATSNLSYQANLPQRSSIPPRPPQQLHRNHAQTYQLAPQHKVPVHANERIANQQRSLREPPRPNAERSNVYRGIR